MWGRVGFAGTTATYRRDKRVMRVAPLLHRQLIAHTQTILQGRKLANRKTEIKPANSCPTTFYAKTGDRKFIEEIIFYANHELKNLHKMLQEQTPV